MNLLAAAYCAATGDFFCVWLHLRLFELRPIIMKQGKDMPRDGKPSKKLNGLFKRYPHRFPTLEKVVMDSKVLWVSREEKKIKASSSWLALLWFANSPVLWIIFLLVGVIVGAVGLLWDQIYSGWTFLFVVKFNRKTTLLVGFTCRFLYGSLSDL